MELYFSRGLSDKYEAISGGGQVSEKNVKSMFNGYSREGKTMGGEAIEKWYQDLNVNVEDPLTLLISFKMGATEQGVYTYD